MKTFSTRHPDNNITPAVTARSTSRRRFIQTTAIATAAVATLPQRSFAESGVPESPNSSDSSEEIIWMSATKLAAQIKAKKVSAVEATKAYIARIEQVNPEI